VCVVCVCVRVCVRVRAGARVCVCVFLSFSQGITVFRNEFSSLAEISLLSGPNYVL
jgi:hypothetical protein